MRTIEAPSDLCRPPVEAADFPFTTPRITVHPITINMCYHAGYLQHGNVNIHRALTLTSTLLITLVVVAAA